MWARNVVFLSLCAGGLWAFQSSVFLRRDAPAPPRATEQHDIDDVVKRLDAEFASLWAAHQVRPAEPANDLAIARRVSLALCGTTPSLEEIRAFESSSESSDARLSKWLDDRLADRRYADYMAERLARAFVGVEDGPFLLYRRRRFVSWLGDELAAGTPYDRIVTHLLSDAGLWTDTPATNFISVTIKPEHDPDANRLAARVARSMLGIRLDCAECHDHPFEPWKQRDFQGLAAFFGQTKQGLRGIRDAAGAFQVENRQTGEKEEIDCTVPFGAEWLLAEGTQRARLAAWVTHHDNRAFARATANRAWALMFGRPLIAPVDNIASGDVMIGVLDLLADDFTAHGYDLRRLFRVIGSSRVFRFDSSLAEAATASVEMESDSTPAHEASWAVFPLVRLRPEQLVGAMVQSMSLATIDGDSSLLTRLARAGAQRDFVTDYGDLGADEFEARSGTIPQRLVMMNGAVIVEKTTSGLLANAAAQIAAFAPTDRAAIETAFLTVLTRRPAAEESEHFVERLSGTTKNDRQRRLADLYWSLLNTTEFAWNH